MILSILTNLASKVIIMELLNRAQCIVADAVRGGGHAIIQGANWVGKVGAPVIDPIVRIALPAVNVVYPVNPVTSRRNIRVIPEFVVNHLGAWHFSVACSGTNRSVKADWTETVTQVGNSLKEVSDRPGLEWEFVVKRDKVPNAACYPGGKTYITTALLEELEPEWLKEEDPELWNGIFRENVAAVLGHEMGHACASHGAGQMQFAIFLKVLGSAAQLGIAHFILSKNSSVEEEPQVKTSPAARRRQEAEKREQAKRLNQTVKLVVNIFQTGWNIASLLLVSGHSRHCEREADAVGMKYALRAGYGSEGMIRVQEILGNLAKGHRSWFAADWLASHPHSDERIANCQKIKRIIDDDVSKLDIGRLEQLLKA